MKTVNVDVNVDVSLNDFDTSEIIEHLEKIYNKGSIEEIRQWLYRPYVILLSRFNY